MYKLERTFTSINPDDYDHYYISNINYTNIYNFIYSIDENTPNIPINISFSLKLLYNNKSVTNIIRYQCPKPEPIYNKFGQHINNIPNILFIYFHNSENFAESYHHFTRIYKLIPRIKITATVSIKIETPYFHEIFMSHVNYHHLTLEPKPTRMFFDIDFKEDITERLSTIYISDLIKQLTSMRLISEPLSYIVTKNDDPKSKSRHIIFTNLILPSIEGCRTLARKLISDLDSCEHYIDLQPYGHNKSLRLFNSYKEHKCKVLDYAVNTEWDVSKSYVQENNLIPTYQIINDTLDTHNIAVDISDVQLLEYSDKLQKYNLSISSNIMSNSCYPLYHAVIEDCPICLRTHDKRDSLYLYIHKFGANIKCHRRKDIGENITLGPPHIEIKKIKKTPEDKIQYYKDIKPRQYESVINNVTPDLVERYTSKNALMPKTILSNCLYQVSPCKSGKTKAIYEYIKTLPEDTSVCFITTQRLFSINLRESFKDLGFTLYCDDNWDRNDKRMILSLYSMHRINNFSKFDLVVIDEIETVALSIKDIKQLGREDMRSENLKRFTYMLRESTQIILMDAYPSFNVIKLFQRLGRTISINFNEYKTHEDDTIIILESQNELAAKIADSILNNKRIVFASALKNKQLEILNQALNLVKQTAPDVEMLTGKSSDLLDDEYNLMDIQYFSSECDRALMAQRIADVDVSFSGNLLAYTPVIMAGTSYEDVCYDELFYLGCPMNGHISALQSLYRVRDISDKKYYIAFGTVGPLQITNIKDLEQGYRFYLDYDAVHTDDITFQELSHNSNNYVLKASLEYTNYSRLNYYKYIIGQFKYNGSTIQYSLDEDKDGKEYKNCFDYMASKTEYMDLSNMIDKIKKMKKNETGENLIGSQIAPFINECDITMDMFKKVNDQEFERLEKITNRTSREQTIYYINMFRRTFPIFDNEPTYEIYYILLNNIERYFKYHNNYINTSKLLTSKNWNSHRGDLLILSDKGQDRFHVIVATKLMCILLNIPYQFENKYNYFYTDVYMEIHDYDYSSFYFTNEDIQLAFIKLFEDEKMNPVFKKQFNTIAFANGRDRSKKPIWERTLRSSITILNMLLKSTYNLCVSSDNVPNIKKHRRFYRDLDIFNSS